MKIGPYNIKTDDILILAAQKLKKFPGLADWVLKSDIWVDILLEQEGTEDPEIVATMSEGDVLDQLATFIKIQALRIEKDRIQG